MNLKCLSRLPAGSGSNRLNPLNKGVFDREYDQLSPRNQILTLNFWVDELIRFYDLYPSAPEFGRFVTVLPDLQALRACHDLLNEIREIASESGQELDEEVMCNILTIDGVQEDYRRLAIWAV